MMTTQIGLIGSSSIDLKSRVYETAYEVGKEIAKSGCILISGGRTGVMEAACKGCQEEGGISVGILPSTEKAEANPFVDIAIPTGLGWTRNSLTVLASDGIIAIHGGVGTLSEISFAVAYQKPLVCITGVGGWSSRFAKEKIIENAPNPFLSTPNAKKAVEMIIHSIRKEKRRSPELK